jgi:hypothetical protein
VSAKRSSRVEAVTRRLGSSIGGSCIGFALGSLLDPWLLAHHLPVIAQEAIPGIAALGGGAFADMLATQVRKAETNLTEDRKRDNLRKAIRTLREQIETMPDQIVASDLTKRLDRRSEDWEKRVIMTARCEREVNEIREGYLRATGSAQAPSGRQRRSAAS